jgi:hypothetical protein
MNGEADGRTIERMASQAGVEPSQMADMVNSIHQGFYDVASDIVAEAGIDENAFEAFIGANPQQGQKMLEAARAMVMTNDTAGLRDLTDAFYEQADRFMPNEVKAALDEAGYGWRDTPEGLKVLVNGIEVSFNVAVKQRIVNFTR